MPSHDETGLELLVSRQTAQIDPRLAIWQGHRGAAVDWVAQAIRIGDVIAGYGAGNQAAVIAPVETNPGPEESLPVPDIAHAWSR